MRHRPFRIFAIAAGLGVASGLASPMALAAAGKVLLVSGVAKVHGAKARTLQKGDEVEVGDVVTTDAGGRLQLLMGDGGRIVLQPDSSLRIDEFAMPSAVTDPNHANAASAAGKSVATLLSGRIDASAGAVGAMTIHSHGDPVTLTRGRSDFVSLDAASGTPALPVLEDAERPPELPMGGRTRLGLQVNLLAASLPQLPQISAAITVPSTAQPAFAASATERADTLAFGSGGSVLQLNSLMGPDPSAEVATYLSGTAALVDFGANGASGIRWGRWSTGTASIATRDGDESVDLQNASLHWIAGPVFEARPVLPTSGSIHFALAGGTSPTDTLGHAGAVNAGVFSADFTAQRVSVQLSLDVNGYNWYASGSGPLTSNSARFNGSFGTVLVDGRVSGNGAFSGFLSAGPLTSDQVNGAGVSYWLNASQGSLGTVSGVVAFIPGSMVPLTPQVVQRNVAYAAGGLLTSDLAGGSATNNRGDYLTDSAGNLTSFRAPLPHTSGATFALGLSRNVNVGFDPATGIRWGRWQGSAIDVTAPPAASRSYDLSSESLHWIAGNEFGGSPTIPQSGTATYALVGNTDPTDTSGNLGVLGAASLSADFTNRVVSSQLTLNVDGRTWYASGAATFPLGGERIKGTYDDVRIGNLAQGQGTINGFFTQSRLGSATADGAAIAYNLADNAGQTGAISGVLAFAKGAAGPAVTLPAIQDRDITAVSPDFATGGTFVSRAGADTFNLDSEFQLTSMPGVTNTVSAEAARYTLGSGVRVDSDVSPLVMLRWGRWSGGSAMVTKLADNTTYSVDLSQQSIHWVESADSAAPPVIPQFGTATYALIGATSPTDRAGHAGMLNNASLSADFTHQTVGANLDFTVNNVNFVAHGAGSIGASAGLPAHQFNGTITSGVVSGSGATPQGSFSGFFSGPASPRDGVPGGAGLSYTVTDGHGLTVDGAAAFRGH